MNKNKNWFENQVLIVLLLFLFFPLGLYLMWRHTDWSKRTKYIITGFFAFFLFITLVTDEPDKDKQATVKEPEQEKVDPEITNTDTTSLTPSEDADNMQDYLDEIMLLIRDLTTVNNQVIEVGTLGSELKFNEASSKLQVAKLELERSQTRFNKLTAPEEFTQIHKDFNAIYLKLSEALDYYDRGLDTFDADLISKGVESHNESNLYINKVTEGLQKMSTDLTN